MARANDRSQQSAPVRIFDVFFFIYTGDATTALGLNIRCIGAPVGMFASIGLCMLLLVTDAGLVAVARGCPGLRYLDLCDLDGVTERI